MTFYDKNAADKIFDVILTEALNEDCEREVALYKDSGHEHVFSENFDKRIAVVEKKLKQKKNATKLKKSAPKLITTAAAVIVCVALATNPSVSAFVRDIYMKIVGGFNQHEFRDDIEITVENFNHELRPAYLPESYRIVYAYYGFISVSTEYIDSDGNVMEIKYGSAASGVIGVDNENSEPYATLVNGREAVFYKTFTEDRPSYLLWTNGGYAFVISAQFDLAELVKIAESIKIS